MSRPTNFEQKKMRKEQIIRLLQKEPMSLAQIAIRSQIPYSTVKHVLDEFVKQNVLIKKPNYADMRKPLYCVNNQRCGED